MRLQDMAEGRKDLYMMTPEKLVEDPGWNVRKSGEELDSHVRWLADSIKEKGVQEPLTIWMNGDIPTVTNGHCRLLAVKLAKKEGVEIKTVPVRVEERYASEGDRILSLITRNSGRPLTPLETSEVLRRLVAYGWSAAEVSKKTGYSAGQVGNLLKLSSFGPELTNPIQRGEVSATLVIEEVKKRGEVGAKESISGAIKTAKLKGNKKATKKDIPFTPPLLKKLPFSKINWEIWGPQLLKALTLIIETPITKVGLPISAARELIDKIKQ